MRNEGKGEELGGKLKAGVGKLIGNEKMQAEGRFHEAKGKARQQVARAAAKAKGKADEALGAAKGGLGEALDDERMEAEGRLQELDGRERQARQRE